MTRMCGKKRTPRVTIAEQRQIWADQGNVDELWKVLIDSDLSMIDPAEILRLLHKSIERKAQKDPAGFAELLQARMTSLVAYLVFRAHYHVTKTIRQFDQVTRGRGIVRSCEEADAVLPQLILIQTHMAELQQSFATTRRLLALARRTEQAETHHKKLKRRRRPAHSRVGAATPATNGTPVNRLEGLLDN